MVTVVVIYLVNSNSNRKVNGNGCSYISCEHNYNRYHSPYYYYY